MWTEIFQDGHPEMVDGTRGLCCSYIKPADAEGETQLGSLIRTGLEDLREFTKSREAWGWTRTGV